MTRPGQAGLAMWRSYSLNSATRSLPARRALSFTLGRYRVCRFCRCRRGSRRGSRRGVGLRRGRVPFRLVFLLLVFLHELLGQFHGVEFVVVHLAFLLEHFPIRCKSTPENTGALAFCNEFFGDVSLEKF